MQSSDGSIRLILNASQSAHTQSSRFLSEAFGSGVQHIALATSDIFGTAKTLAANGVALLPIPENYYDDLEARSDLPVAAIDRLKLTMSFTSAKAKGSIFSSTRKLLTSASSSKLSSGAMVTQDLGFECTEFASPRRRDESMDPTRAFVRDE